MPATARRALAVLLLVSSAISVALPARAESDDDAAVRARIAAVERGLDAAEPRTRLWRNTWLVTFAALAAGQGGFAAITTNRDLRVDAAVGGAKSALAFLALLVAPHPATSAADELRAQPARTPAERRAKLRRAESLLRDVAKQQRFEQSWLPRMASAVVNLAGAYVMWIGYQRFATGWLSIGSGLAVSELQIRTAPSALAGYRAGTAGPASPASGWMIVPGPRGISVSGSF